MSSGGKRDHHAEAARWRTLLRRFERLAGQAHLAGQSATAQASDTGAQNVASALPARWRMLSAEDRLVAAEQSVRRAGADRGWVEDARTVGTLRAEDPDNPVQRQCPPRTLGLEEFLVDVLDRDLWLLERMAALHVGRHERMTAGSWQADQDTVGETLRIEHLHVRYARAAHIVLAVQITPAEGELLWGSGAEEGRRDHARVVAAMSESQLSAQWRAFADAPARLLMRSYLREDPSTGQLLWKELTEPPDPEAMIAAATEAHNTVRTTGQPVTGVEDRISAAVQATGADAGGEWIEVPPTHSPVQQHDRGPGHDPGES
ncbi:hypothetical protein ACFU44_06025 [Nocardia rhizosphaerihabitans]|uniref:hypothetical protein n=1 Tax=Nocardia rhizosphaerihabitans TaxID=1691570 RepID=UPI00366BB105